MKYKSINILRSDELQEDRPEWTMSVNLNVCYSKWLDMESVLATLTPWIYRRGNSLNVLTRLI